MLLQGSVSSLPTGEKKHWWLTNKAIVEKYVKDAKLLIANGDQNEMASAINFLDAALAIAPRFEQALELKAKSLLNLRRYKDIADMLHDYIPSVKISMDDDEYTLSSDNSSCTMLSKEQSKLLSSHGDEPSFKCFPVSDLKNKFLAVGLFKSCEKEGQWRYMVLGQACFHLGLIEDARVLLQTGKRLACTAFRRESICWSDDSFPYKELLLCNDLGIPKNSPEISQLLTQTKFLLRRKTAAIAALDTGLYLEAIRQFSKIVDSRYGVPQTFLAECYMYRASAYQSAGRIAEAIADCNKTLALDSSCIEALRTRAALFEAIRCFHDSLHDLEHLKLLYNTILRDTKLSGPAWRRQGVHYREIPGKLCSLASKMQELKQRIASGNVDYYALIGLRRGCSRSELERAHLLLTLRHKPDKSSGFIERCEFRDDCDVASVIDRAKISAQKLHRLIQKGYTSVMSTITSEETADKNRKIATATSVLQSAPVIQVQQGFGEGKISETHGEEFAASEILDHIAKIDNKVAANTTTTPLFQGAFCRDLAVVGNLLSQAGGFNLPIQVNYEALSC